MRILLTFLLLFRLSAAEYYIDFVGGDDANNGTSDATPWKHHPWDPSATGTAAAAAGTIENTSTNYFKGGVSYGGQIRLQADGDATTPMRFTYKSGWGTGMGKFDPTNTLTYAVACRTSANADRFGRNYIFDGLEFYRLGGYAADDPILTNDCSTPITSPVGGNGIYFDAGAENVTIQNCYFHEIGQWRNQPPFSGTGGVTGTGTHIQGGINCTISSNYFSRMKNPISIKGVGSVSTGLVSNVTITSNTFSGGTLWQIDMAPRSSGNVTFSNIVVSANTFNNNGDFDQGNWAGCGSKPHSDCIFFRTASLISDWFNVQVVNNKFFCDDPGSSQGGTAGVYISQGPSVTVEGNVFCGPRVGNGLVTVGGYPFIDAGTTQKVVIRNNTFFGNQRNFYESDANTSTNRTIIVELYNNLFVRQTTGIYEAVQIETNTLTIIRMTNNAYSKIDLDAASAKVVYQSVWETLAEHQARGFDFDSIYAQDPGLAAGTTTPSPTSAGNYRPTAGSALIGAGIYVVGIADDPDGNVRANPPTIGAYEYPTSDPAPIITTQPQSQTIVSGSTADLTVTATGNPTLTYQWYEGSSGDTANPVVGETTTSFTTPTLTVTTSYWVRVTNGAGFADSTTATLTVTSTPSDNSSSLRGRRRI